MGLRLFGNCNFYEQTHKHKRKTKICRVQVNPAAPDPINFEILEIYQVKNHVVAKIRYPDCNNFEGIKICLFLYTTVKKISERAEIDPHFSDDGNSPFARFIPNEIGLKKALELANLM